MIIRATLVSLALLILVKIAIDSTPGEFNPAHPVECGGPQPENPSYCSEMEKQLLRSTVRFTVKGWVVEPGEAGYQADYSAGHATVIGGRYLVTHNHFSFPLSGEAADGRAAYGVMVYLYDSTGLLRFKGPLSDFETAMEAGETLALMHKDEDFFETLGFSSAEFEAWESPPIEPGTEVAQVDWDGATTRVDWVKVEEIVLDAGVPRLVLADDITPGASGGGIFWQGIHVANNWMLSQARDKESGATIDEVTIAALNPRGVPGL